MNRGYRIITTCLIAVGAGFLGFYFLTQNADQKFAMLERPSYYILQNYWYFFLAGIAVLFFSLLGSFFSWFRAMEEKEKVLPNAGYSDQKDITDWVGGTSLDAEQQNVVMGAPGEDERTILLGTDEQTELLTSGDHTELLETDEQTELLVSGEQTELADGQTQEINS